MGLFSSIGGILGGVVGSVFGPGGSVIGSGLGGAIGGAVDSNKANKTAQGYFNEQMDFSKQQAQFQQDYAKHVMEWRVEDAKNAGVHPMAALGVSNPSYSPVSAPSAPSVYDSGQFDTGSTFGQSLNRASMQAKTMEQQQQAAQLGFRTIGLQNKGLELDNQFKALQIAQLASELQRNAASSAPAPKVNNQTPEGLPEAPKKEGYVGEPEIQFNPTADDPNVFTMNAGNDVTALWEDKDIAGIIPLDLWPIIKANAIDYAARLRGKIVNGMVYHNARGGWVSVNGPYGKEALADRLGIGHFVEFARKLINPAQQKNFDPSEYAKRFYTY